MTNNNLSVVDEGSWLELMESLANEVDNNVADREKIVEAAELLLLNYPLREVASILSVTQGTVKRWIRETPSLARVIAEKKVLVSRWRLEQLDRQMLLALKKSAEILSLDAQEKIEYDEDGNELPSEKRTNVKLLGIQAQQSRYVIDTFMKNHPEVDVEQRGKAVTLSMDGEAMGTLVNILSDVGKKHGPTEIVYEVSSNTQNAQPLLDENGNPLFGEFMQLDMHSDGITCHICGKHFKHLITHVRTRHAVMEEDYCSIFMVDIDSIRKAEKSYDETEIVDEDDNIEEGE